MTSVNPASAQELQKIECGFERERQRELQQQAYRIYYRALRTGELVRAEVCERCGKTAEENGKGLDGHHDDYSKPLDVEWLCKSCHSRIPDDNGERKVTMSLPVRTTTEVLREISDRSVVEQKSVARVIGELLEKGINAS